MRAKEIIGLPVETQHGQAIGQVEDIEFDLDSQTVVHYVVTAGGLVKRLVGEMKELLITPVQVISITKDKMTVVDLVNGQPVDVYEELTEDDQKTVAIKKPA